MTLPLKADWIAGNSYSASNANDTEAAASGLGAGTLAIPYRVYTPSSAATLTLTVAYSVYVHTGSGATWTMPTVSAGTYELVCYNRGTGTLIIQRASSNQIMKGQTAVTSVTVPKGAAARFISDGTYWLLIAGGLGGLAPEFDHCAVSAKQVNTAYNATFTWSQTVGTNAKGFVIINNYNPWETPNTLTSTVTFGGVDMPFFGWNGDNRWQWQAWFGPGDIPEGTQTVSAKLHTSNTNTLYGWGQSVTYTNVNQVGTLQTPAGHVYYSSGPTDAITPAFAPCTLLANYAVSDNYLFFCAMPNFTMRTGNTIYPVGTDVNDSGYVLGDVIGWPTTTPYIFRLQGDNSSGNLALVTLGA